MVRSKLKHLNSVFNSDCLFIWEGLGGSAGGYRGKELQLSVPTSASLVTTTGREGFYESLCGMHVLLLSKNAVILYPFFVWRGRSFKTQAPSHLPSDLASRHQMEWVLLLHAVSPMNTLHYCTFYVLIKNYYNHVIDTYFGCWIWALWERHPQGRGE